MATTPKSHAAKIGNIPMPLDKTETEPNAQPSQLVTPRDPKGQPTGASGAEYQRHYHGGE